MEEEVASLWARSEDSSSVGRIPQQADLRIAPQIEMGRRLRVFPNEHFSITADTDAILFRRNA